MKTRLSLNAFLLVALLLIPVVSGLAQKGDLAAADAAYASGTYDKAIQFSKKAVKANESDARAWQVLGNSYLNLNKYKDAVKALQKAAALEPSNDGLQATLAFAYVTVRDQRAEQTAETALKLNQNNATAHYILGVLSYRDESYVAAYDRAKRAITLNPNFAAPYRLKAQALVASFMALTGKVLPPGARGDLLVEATADLEKYVGIASTRAGEALKEELAAIRYFANYYSLPENRLARDVTIVEPPDPNSTKLKVLTKPKPEYTNSARQRNVQGTCVLLVAFDVSGKIGPMLIVRSLDDDLDRAAISAAHAMKFVPPTKNGVPYSTVRRVEYTFSIY